MDNMRPPHRIDITDNCIIFSKCHSIIGHQFENRSNCIALHNIEGIFDLLFLGLGTLGRRGTNIISIGIKNNAIEDYN